MKDIERISSNIKPESIIKLGNNTYYYNFDIESYDSTVHNTTTDEDEAVVMYKYVVCHLEGQPNYKDCVKAVIRKYISADEEFDIINSYNKYLIDGTELEDRDKYLSYLELLNDIKLKVKADFE